MTTMTIAEAANRASAAKLVEDMCREPWHSHCSIILNYMPPHPRPDTLPIVVVRCESMQAFLRHSKGPRQGFFWDCYGDDMQTIELAILALSQAPAPVNCGPVVFRLKQRAEKARLMK